MSARIPSFIAATLTGVLAAGALTLGVAGLQAQADKDDHGYLTTGAERFATPTAAISTDNLDLDFGGMTSAGRTMLGKLQLKVRSTNGKPVFVGVAKTSDVSTYLHGVSHTTLRDFEVDPFRADYRRHRGASNATAPGRQRFWVASAHGAGEQTLRWKLRDGDWSIVVMNADGTPGVSADVDAGASIPMLVAVGWGGLGLGLLLLTGTAALILTGIRAGSQRAAEAHVA